MIGTQEIKSSPHTSKGVVYKADGSIDYDYMLTEGMSEHNQKILSKNNGTTSIMTHENYIAYEQKLKDAKNRGNGKAIKPKKIEEILESVDDSNETEDIIADDEETKKPIIVKSIPTSNSKALEEIREFPELKSDIISSVADINADYDKLSGSQRINVFDVGNRWGKTDVKLYGITRTGGRIYGHKVINFGSIDDYDIDTMPIHAIRSSGQEITYLTQLNKNDGKRLLISRRFASNILSYWANIIGIRYTPHKGEKCAIEIWGRNVEGFTNTVITGDDIVLILKDLLYIIRHDTIHKGSLSKPLRDIIEWKAKNEKTSEISVLNDMKKRIYWDFQIGRFGWAYPKMHPDYIKGLIHLLNKKDYIMDLAIPLIYDRYTYPIRCTGTHVRPLTDEQHDKNSEDYDIAKYIWERE